MKEDIRWIQRLSNLKRAYTLLSESLEIKAPSDVERAGIIQFYEMTFELSWKVMKDYLQAQGYDINSPRHAIKQAFQTGLINDGHDWIQALTDRNLTVHTYDEEKARQVELAIRNAYYPLINKLLGKLNQESLL
jgi:nucleotidyltransferase substrate binding protein (TIGR01987 family)